MCTGMLCHSRVAFIFCVNTAADTRHNVILRIKMLRLQHSDRDPINHHCTRLLGAAVLLVTSFRMRTVRTVCRLHGTYWSEWP